MSICGMETVSLNDYYGKVSCALFIFGCNFFCPYCHNPKTVIDKEKEEVDETEIMDLLKARKGLYDGVVISGGEPTLDEGLFDLCYSIKKLNYQIKLDTNGSRPDVLAELLDLNLVDYIAMDIKTAPELYTTFTSESGIVDAIEKSADIIMSKSTDYEFRTTCANSLIDREIIKKICCFIKGAKQYTLQPFNINAPSILNKAFFGDTSIAIPEAEMLSLLEVAKPMVKNCRFSLM